MSTRATAELKWLAAEWEKLFKSAVVSGIVGDRAHAARGGYHISREDQPSGNYSVTRTDDKTGPGDAAAAIDMTMSTADMKACTARLVKMYADTTDPRRKYINAFNGWQGTGGAQRWDVYARKVKSATADHKWHVHLEIRRRYVTSKTAMEAILSVLRGESAAAYLKRIGGSAPAVSQSSTPAAPRFPGILRRNDKQSSPNASVRVFQAQLMKRGVTAVGSADGFFGPKMEAAVKAWQKRVGLVADGVVGAKTWPTPWTFR